MHPSSFLIPYLVAAVMAMPPIGEEPGNTPQPQYGVNHHASHRPHEHNHNGRHGLAQYGEVKHKMKNLRTPISEGGMVGDMGDITLPTNPRQPSERPGSPTSRLAARAHDVMGPKFGGGGTSGDGGDVDTDDQPNPRYGAHRNAHSRLPVGARGGTSGDGGDDYTGDQPNRKGHGGDSRRHGDRTRTFTA